MKILIIEDEKPASDLLIKHLKYYSPDIEILGILRSVKESVEWLNKKENRANLIIMDIMLTDGLSFEIFNQVKINTPVLFTTAYDKYALNAFKVNSIDYLLKPISYNDLYNSLEKYNNFKESILGTKERLQYEELDRLLSRLKKDYKNRFMIKVGEHIKSIKADKIAFFYAEGRDVSLVTSNFREYIINYKLEELEELLDPALFFRINRTFIVNIDAIEDVTAYTNSRLEVKLSKPFPKELIVSREKVSEFKYWFNGEIEPL
ncbi:MAG: response regulator transcription factor [Bacteroidales bacterium]|nr:response regulator transcription factor [Bacteroidales bacterium]